MSGQRLTQTTLAPGIAGAPRLKRTLNLPLLLLYGLGTILGAGIYVLTGEVVAEAGSAAPLSFLIAAIVAAPTAYSYAQLSSRHPKSAGEAAYVNEAFHRVWLTRATGSFVIFIGIVSAAAMAKGFVGYAAIVTDIPAVALIVGLVVSLTALAGYGVLAAASIAALIAILEVFGLLVIIAGGLMQTEYQPLVYELDAMPWAGVFAGAFLAFYAFIGFEDIVNMAEETQNPSKTLPWAIFGSLGLASILYVAVTLIAVLTVPVSLLSHSSAPMALVVESHGYMAPGSIAVISMLAVVNGSLVQMMMASRVIYGMSRMQSRLPLLGRVNARTGTPVYATLLVGGLVLTLALLMDIRRLASLTSIVTLLVFLAVNLALCKLQQGDRGWRKSIPWLGATLCVLLSVMVPL